MISHKKEYGVYHWDTFDNEVFLITKNWDIGEKAEFDNLGEAIKFVDNHYGDRIRPSGADRVDIVDSKGRIVKNYNIG